MLGCTKKSAEELMKASFTMKRKIEKPPRPFVKFTKRINKSIKSEEEKMKRW